ncbi:MAG: restriction endonuclease subunit S [Deltaproteobacteria bacterium]|nr:restriction endonuclease subunit S [Deltaproteobacteria bacterium]
MSQYQDGLPQGWAMAEFDDVAEVEANLVEPSAFLDSPHVAPNHIESGTGRLLPYQSIRADGVTSPKHLFRPGQILYSKIRPYLAKVTLVDFAGLCSADMYPVRADIVPGFLQQWLVSPMFTALASQSQSRTVLPKINKRALGTKAVPVPPLNEQKRIVARIEALQRRSSAAKEALDAIPPLLEKFRQSVLAAAFRGDLTRKWREAHPDVEPATELLARIRAERRRRWEEAKPGKKYVEPEPVDTSGLPELPKGWCWASVEELCWDGPTNGYSGATEAGSSGTLTMKLSATTQGKLLLNDSTTKRLSETLGDESKFWLKQGDLLVQRANSLSYLGAAAIFDCAEEPMVYPDLMMRIRVVEPIITALLWRYFNSMACRGWFRANATGTAGNMPKISGAILRRTAVPLPSAGEVEQLLEVVGQTLEVVDAVTEPSSELSDLLAPLNQSILAKAFRGELVPQDPNDEPASVLLERIRQEREAAGDSSATGRRGRKPKQARRS